MRSTVWSVTGFGLILFALGFADVSYEARQDSWRLGEQAVGNVARLAEQSISREIELYNLSLQAVIDGVLDPKVMEQEPAIRSQILFDRSTTARGLGFTVVLDATGAIILDSKAPQARTGNFASREFFAVHSGNRGDGGLYVSRPFKAQLDDGRWTIALSRRITAPDGSFRGVVSGFLKLDYINNILQTASLGSDGIVSVLRDDGVLIARSVFDETLLGLDWKRSEVFAHLGVADEGLFTKTSLNDGRVRLYAYRRIAGTPLVLTSGLPVDHILRPWLLRTIVFGGIIFLLASAVVALVAMLDRELTRRAAAERAAAALARTDGLTGVANRRMFDETLARDLGRAARSGQCVSLLMFDVDWFKAYNDAHGHVRGDQALIKIAQTIQSAVRSEIDLLARYGGEEFAVVLTHEEADDAVVVARRILKHVRLAEIAYPESPFGHVTVSCGVATRERGGLEDASALLEEADARLYAAKRAGRDCFRGAPVLTQAAA